MATTKIADWPFASALVGLRLAGASVLGANSDYVEASKWFTLTADGPVDCRKGLTPKMTTEQVAAGKKLAASWNAEHKDQKACTTRC